MSGAQEKFDQLFTLIHFTERVRKGATPAEIIASVTASNSKETFQDARYSSAESNAGPEALHHRAIKAMSYDVRP